MEIGTVVISSNLHGISIIYSTTLRCKKRHIVAGVFYWGGGFYFFVFVVAVVCFLFLNQVQSISFPKHGTKHEVKFSVLRLKVKVHGPISSPSKPRVLGGW